MKIEFFKKYFPWRLFYRVVFLQTALVVIGMVGFGWTVRSMFRREILNQTRQHIVLVLNKAEKNFPINAKTTVCDHLDIPKEWLVAIYLKDGSLLCRSKDASEEWINAFPLDPAAVSVNRSWIAKEPWKDYLNAVLIFPSKEQIYLGASTGSLSSLMSFLDTSLGIALLVMALAFIGIAIWFARQIVFPLGRLLVKTQNIVKQVPESFFKEDFAETGFAEWQELESNIDDISKDLAQKTQRLNREQLELHAVMGAISDGILAVDLEGIPLFYNSRFAMLFHKDYVKQHKQKLWEWFREPEILTAYEQALHSGQNYHSTVFPMEIDGDRKYFMLSVSPLKRHDGSVYGALGSFHDVTDLKSAEQMRIDFVANVSHELRTPLTVIKGYADTLALELAKDSTLQAYVQSITRNTDRLTNLMGDLLDLSSIESDSFLTKEVLSTQSLSEKSTQLLSKDLAQKNQSVKIDIQAPYVYADGNRVEQVLVNLLSNANKYTPEKGKIFIRWSEDEKGTLLTIEDTGAGISRDHLPRLFERFYRIDKARSREQGGTGLGLAIVKHIMQRHSGSVWVESEVGKGSRFYCRFPKEEKST